MSSRNFLSEHQIFSSYSCLMHKIYLMKTISSSKTVKKRSANPHYYQHRVIWIRSFIQTASWNIKAQHGEGINTDGWDEPIKLSELNMAEMLRSDDVWLHLVEAPFPHFVTPTPSGQQTTSLTHRTFSHHWEEITAWVTELWIHCPQMSGFGGCGMFSPDKWSRLHTQRSQKKNVLPSACWDVWRREWAVSGYIYSSD